MKIEKIKLSEASFKSCSSCPLYSKKKVSTNSLKPSFSFKYLQQNFGIEQCSKDEKSALLDAIIKRSSMTWAEIEQAPRHGLGKENISLSSIKTRLPPCIKEDTKLWSFRFFGKAPFVGFREQETFHIIWIDRNFTLYNHS